MPPKKKADAPDPVQIAGYRRQPVYARREFKQIQESSDIAPGKPLEVKVQVNLSLGQKEDIEVGPGVTFRTVFEQIAPYIVEWNVDAPDAETGELVRVPAPAQAGADVLRALDDIEALWLISVVKQGRSYGISDEDEKKDLTTSDPTDES